MIEAIDGAEKGSLRRKRSHVKLICQASRERWRLPIGIIPAKVRMVEHARSPMDATGLPPGSRIRRRRLVIDQVGIVIAGAPLRWSGVPSAGFLPHWDNQAVALDRNLCGLGRPHPKNHALTC